MRVPNYAFRAHDQPRKNQRLEDGRKKRIRRGVFPNPSDGGMGISSIRIITRAYNHLRNAFDEETCALQISNNANGPQEHAKARGAVPARRVVCWAGFLRCVHFAAAKLTALTSGKNPGRLMDAVAAPNHSRREADSFFRSAGNDHHAAKRKEVLLGFLGARSG